MYFPNKVLEPYSQWQIQTLPKFFLERIQKIPSWPVEPKNEIIEEAGS
jgi:hypothetical protein